MKLSTPRPCIKKSADELLSMSPWKDLRSRDGSSHIHSARGLFFGSTCFKFIMALVLRGAVPSAFLTLTSRPPTNLSNSRLATPSLIPSSRSEVRNTILSEPTPARSSSVMSSALIRTVTVFATSSLCFPLLNRKVATSVIKGVHLSALHSPASLTRTFVFTSLSPLLLPAACTIFAAFFTAFTAFISHSSTLRPHQSAASVVDCRPETSPFHVASV
mmetsp:Transcript_18592/g.32963  ORF Transcript_18592/g.32963 Transcript_18592/m.32963 type:complete len:217 (-) Transcript_18592:178-828(-)